MSGSPEANHEAGWSLGRVVRAILGVEVIVLLALAQVIFAGYRLGVGNQSIQIPFLKHLIDPTLFANDSMVQQTLGDYHSYFFKILAGFVGKRDLESAYFWLHVITAAGVLGAAYSLGRAMFKSRAAAAVLMLLMLAGHHRALAGDDLYSPGFTHTWAVFPLAIWAMALFYKERYWAALVLAGVIFNLHALTAGYLLAMFAAWAIADIFSSPNRVAALKQWAGRMLLFALIAAPTLLEMMGHKQIWDAQWLARTRTRSADHSFPTSWWATGVSDVPRFAMMIGLAAMSLSFATPGRTRRKSVWMAAAVGMLFVIGFVFSEVWPVATVVRAQLYRSSRLLMVLMLAQVAYGIVRGWSLIALPQGWRRLAQRAGGRSRRWLGSATQPPPNGPAPVVNLYGQPPRADDAPTAAQVVGCAMEVALASVTFVLVAAPGMMALAPWLLLAAIGVAIANARLSWQQAAVACAALLVAVMARASIDFHIPGIGSDYSIDGVFQRIDEAGDALWVALGIAVVALALMRAPIGPRLKMCGAMVLFYACAMVGLYGRVTFGDSVDASQRSWVAVQRWAEQNTPRDAVFLTPPQQGGFRVYSQRPVVCEWRDGTQLYFTAAFDWWDKLKALRPTSQDDGGGTTPEAGVLPLEKMSDDKVIDLARRFGASYVVLPTGQTPRDLKFEAGNEAWAIYRPRMMDAREKFARDEEQFIRGEQTFIHDVALPNIEKYRKSDARLELADGDGQTVTDGAFQVTQTKQAFGFGVSIPFFQTPVGDRAQDFEPPPVTEKQLERVKGVFNYTVIPFSAKWQRIEPEEGERHYEELDKYVDWCVRNGITMEFHYLSGFTPRWVRFKTEDDQRLAWVRHCRETVERYHDRIKFWQVINDERLFKWAPEVFKEIHAKYPDLKLGMSECSTFYTPKEGQWVPALTAGMDEIEDLQAQGVKLDYFATHGHKPMGCWPDMRLMYACLDEFEKKGVKIHISEATLDTGMKMISPIRKETAWTPELVAEFYERFYTVAFSHPAMEAINYWDLGASIDRTAAVRGMMNGGGGGGPPAQRPPLQGGMSITGTGQAGMLEVNDDATPRPLYNTLKELITQRWMTRLSGQVGSDGAVTFRGFHGDYEVTVRTAAGKELRGRFTIKPDSTNVIQLRLAEGGGSLAKGD